MIDDDNALIAHKWVRILVDSCAEGVWEKGGGATSVDDLPVAQDLRERILAWQRWYDRDEDSWGIFRGDVEGLSREGLAIARSVKAALPDWTVIYLDEAEAREAGDGPRELFEYEIRG